MAKEKKIAPISTGSMADLKLKIEYRALASLVPYIGNPRKNDPVVDNMAAGIKEYGFRYPILIKSDGSVVDGHLRIKAARKLGMTEIPVVLADDMSEAQIKAFRLYVNRLPESVEWDEDKLRKEMEALKAMDFDLDMTGFSTEELSALMPNLETLQELPEESVEINPFKKTHVLLSFSPEKLVLIQDHLNAILEIEGIEYETGSN